jgi:hypothetical protein
MMLALAISNGNFLVGRHVPTGGRRVVVNRQPLSYRACQKHVKFPDLKLNCPPNADDMNATMSVTFQQVL